MIDSISDLRKEVRKLGEKISAPFSLLCVAGGPTNNGGPHIEIKDGKYHYVITERGEEYDRKITDAEEDILYWIFKDVTSEMASDYEVKNRKKDVDFRRLKFSKQLQLMCDINLNWGNFFLREIEDILKNNPYDDLMDMRSQYCSQLMDQGVSGAEAYIKACEIYPLP